MASSLKIVSGIYLVFIWGAYALFLIASVSALGIKPSLLNLLAILAAVVLSLPAVILFAFGAVVADTRKIRENLDAMRRYYEPDRIL